MVNYKNLLIINEMIRQIFESPFEVSLQIFAQNLPYLEDVYFILPYSKGINYTAKFKKLNLDDLDVLHFFESETLYCLNQESLIAEIMMRQNFALKIVSCVSLDTQIQSYIYRQYKKQIVSVPQSIEELKKIKNSHLCCIDCLAYTLENALFNLDYLDSPVYIENSEAFELYFYNDLTLAQNSSRQIINLSKDVFASTWGTWYRRQYKLYYLALLMMTDININFNHLSVYEKEKMIVQYFHENIGIISEREMNLAKLFFMHGTKINFFGKIQKGRNDIIKNLKNMAWDIFHIQNTLNNITIQTNSNVDFTIPFFVTYDERLKGILPVYRIKAAAFIKNTRTKFTQYTLDLIDPIIKQKYFTAEAYAERAKSIAEADEQILFDKIEQEINIIENKFIYKKS